MNTLMGQHLKVRMAAEFVTTIVLSAAVIHISDNKDCYVRGTDLLFIVKYFSHQLQALGLMTKYPARALAHTPMEIGLSANG